MTTVTINKSTIPVIVYDGEIVMPAAMINKLHRKSTSFVSARFKMLEQKNESLIKNSDYFPLEKIDIDDMKHTYPDVQFNFYANMKLFTLSGYMKLMQKDARKQILQKYYKIYTGDIEGQLISISRYLNGYTFSEKECERLYQNEKLHVKFISEEQHPSEMQCHLLNHNGRYFVNATRHSEHFGKTITADSKKDTKTEISSDENICNHNTPTEEKTNEPANSANKITTHTKPTNETFITNIENNDDEIEGIDDEIESIDMPEIMPNQFILFLQFIQEHNLPIEECITIKKKYRKHIIKTIGKALYKPSVQQALEQLLDVLNENELYVENYIKHPKKYKKKLINLIDDYNNNSNK